MRFEGEEGFSEEFKYHKERLRALEKRFNPKELNLHFGAPKDAEVWPGLWADIEALAREGLARINMHRDYFLTRKAPSAMYDDGMYWYDLFLLIHAVGISQAHSQNVNDDPLDDTIDSILKCLVEISEYTAVVPADIFKRNWEALADFLFAFPYLAETAAEMAEGFEEGHRKQMVLGAAHYATGRERDK